MLRGGALARKIGFVSGKGGVGKTFVCSTLANFIAWRSYKVVVIDLNFGLNNVDLIFNLEKKIKFDLFDVIYNNCNVMQSIVQDNKNSHLYIISSNRVKIDVDINDLKKVISSMENLFDYILIDFASGAQKNVLLPVKLMDEIIVVVSQNLASIRDASKLKAVFSDMKINNVKCIVNNVRGDLILSKRLLSIEEIYKLLNIKIIGAIPNYEKVNTIDVHKIYETHNNLNRAFSLICDNLINNTARIFDCTKEFKGIKGCLKKYIRRIF
jgi:septum formation inhibitor-activating ATPase MinD